MSAPHDKLQGLKPGDRVRVTFEGDLTETSSVDFWPVTLEGLSAPTLWVCPDNSPSPTIERIEPPLAVSDTVQWGAGVQGYIVHIDGLHAWVRSGHSDSVLMVDDLERIP